MAYTNQLADWPSIHLHAEVGHQNMIVIRPHIKTWMSSTHFAQSSSDVMTVRKELVTPKSVHLQYMPAFVRAFVRTYVVVLVVILICVFDPVCVTSGVRGVIYSVVHPSSRSEHVCRCWGYSTPQERIANAYHVETRHVVNSGRSPRSTQPTWRIWKHFPGSNIAPTGYIKMELRTLTSLVFDSIQSYTFSGCSKSTKKYEVSGRGGGRIRHVGFSIEYTPVNLCSEENRCDFAATNCVCLGDRQFRCECKPGYFKLSEKEESCKPINPCTISNGQCDTNSTLCHNTGSGTRLCDCRDGFRRYTDTKCIPNNPCEETPEICGSGASCIYLKPGEFECKCHVGYNATKEGSNDTSFCHRIDHCQSVTHTCTDKQICIVTGPLEYDCISCENPENVNVTMVCESINPCLTNQNLCGKNAQCVFTGAYDIVLSLQQNHPISDASAKKYCIPINPCEEELDICGKHLDCHHVGPNKHHCVAPSRTTVQKVTSETTFSSNIDDDPAITHKNDINEPTSSNNMQKTGAVVGGIIGAIIFLIILIILLFLHRRRTSAPQKRSVVHIKASLSASSLKDSKGRSSVIENPLYMSQQEGTLSINNAASNNGYDNFNQLNLLLRPNQACYIPVSTTFGEYIEFCGEMQENVSMSQMLNTTEGYKYMIPRGEKELSQMPVYETPTDLPTDLDCDTLPI
eukprot:gene7363-9749_t